MSFALEHIEMAGATSDAPLKWKICNEYWKFLDAFSLTVEYGLIHICLGWVNYK